MILGVPQLASIITQLLNHFPLINFDKIFGEHEAGSGSFFFEQVFGGSMILGVPQLTSIIIQLLNHFPLIIFSGIFRFDVALWFYFLVQVMFLRVKTVYR